MLKIELTKAEAQAIIDQLYGVTFDVAALRRAANKISSAVDQADAQA